MDFVHASRSRLSDEKVDAPLSLPAESALDSYGETGLEQISKDLDKVRSLCGCNFWDELAESFFAAFGGKSETVSNGRCEQVVHDGAEVGKYSIVLGNGWDVRLDLHGSTSPPCTGEEKEDNALGISAGEAGKTETGLAETSSPIGTPSGDLASKVKWFNTEQSPDIDPPDEEHFFRDPAVDATAYSPLLGHLSGVRTASTHAEHADDARSAAAAAAPSAQAPAAAAPARPSSKRALPVQCGAAGVKRRPACAQ